MTRTARRTARNPLTRRERRQHMVEHYQRQREAMTPEQVREAMRKAMHTAITARDGVTRSDLLRANIPPEQIDLHFRGVLLAVLEERKNGVYE